MTQVIQQSHVGIDCVAGPQDGGKGVCPCSTERQRRSPSFAGRSRYIGLAKGLTKEGPTRPGRWEWLLIRLLLLCHWGWEGSCSCSGGCSSGCCCCCCCHDIQEVVWRSAWVNRDKRGLLRSCWVLMGGRRSLIEQFEASLRNYFQYCTEQLNELGVSSPNSKNSNFADWFLSRLLLGPDDWHPSKCQWPLEMTHQGIE